MYEDEYLEQEELEEVEETLEEDHSSEGEEVTGEEKTFTQKDVDRIIGNKLKKERAKYLDYEDMREIVNALQEYGYSGSAKEIRAAIRSAVDEEKKRNELANLQEEAEKFGTDPQLLREIRELKAELSEIKKEKEEKIKEVEAKKQEEAHFQKQVSDFNDKYPDILVEELAEDTKFMKFVNRANPSLSLIEVYEDYMELTGQVEALALQKASSKASRSTSSGRSKVDSSGGTYGLSAEQQKLAKQNGMTYKEYSERLSRIRK